MVYALEQRENKRGFETVLSTGQVLNILGITKQTLYKWIMLGRIKAITHEIGKRVFLEFHPKEVERVKLKMKDNREKGKTLIKEK